jgi:hypothetical protein
MMYESQDVKYVSHKIIIIPDSHLSGLQINCFDLSGFSLKTAAIISKLDIIHMIDRPYFDRILTACLEIFLLIWAFRNQNLIGSRHNVISMIDFSPRNSCNRQR